MKRNLFRMFAIEQLNGETYAEFLYVQGMMNMYNIKFSVLIFKHEIGIIAFGVKENSKEDLDLKSKGFNEEG